MKIVIVNGSARKGNTFAAINAFVDGAKESNEIEVLQADKLKIGFCKGCNLCESSKGCVDNDDTNPTVDKLVGADVIVFASPVYWWGLTAQIKLVIDKCYCRGAQMKGKKIGVLVPGGSPVEATQYELIKKQFECMAEYLSWDILFYKPFYAYEKDEIKNNADIINELKKLGKNI